ncbi:cytochrome c biogenesis protein ResB [Mobilicoccus pelagius]|uniref:Cytochrome c biogenesis protein ResB n=1 Tax=Mobilicoccus pelagius NBRC 104925 TaxID=1089455 RepID=H5US88_9MICO|nr:cytochrome c biogenesis protein ResB [Mobilicoccus pelagius]GAB48596.1 cytochrome c biogenesis protein ResB [Mobilicoccus pelagius NBRC 104925]
MTDTHTRPEILDDDLEPLPAEPAPRRSRRQDTPVEAFFHRVFAFFHNKKVGLLLILAMAVFTLVGALIAQVPADIRADPESYADWLGAQRPKYGGWVPILDAVGAFSTFSSWWFKLTSVLLGLSIVACTLHRLPGMWQKATRPHLHVTEPFFDHAKIRETVVVPTSPQETVAHLRDLLGRRRYRVLDDPKGAGYGLYADRYRWMPFGTVIAHASFVVLLVGMLVSANTGFSENVPVTVGGKVDVGHDTGLTVEVKGFSDTYHPDGRPLDYVSDVVLYDDGAQVARQDVRVNTPLRHEGVAIHQSWFGTSAVVTVTDANGRRVFSDGIPLQYTSDDEQHSIGRVTVPGTDLELYIVTPASGQVQSDIPAGQAQMELQKPGVDRPLASERLVPGDPVTAEGYTVTLDREAKFTGLMIKKDPGAIWVWIGSALMMIGLITTMGFTHRRVWVRVDPVEGGTRVRAATSDKSDVTFRNWFRGFADDVARLGTTPTPTARHDHETRV